MSSISEPCMSIEKCARVKSETIAMAAILCLQLIDMIKSFQSIFLIESFTAFRVRWRVSLSIEIVISK